MRKIEGVVACICEGAAEQAIIEILFKNTYLIFEELLDDKVIKERSARSFERNYLSRGFDNILTV